MADDEELPPKPEAYSLTTDSGEQPGSVGFTGRGKAAYKNGDVYEGLYDNGRRHGKGTYTYYGGDEFQGIFVENKKSGLGRVTYKNGAFYHGYFKEGLREGEGTFKYANGDIYSGMWKAGKKHGRGTYVYFGTKYEFKGDWKEGQITQGTWSFTDGTRYTGFFQNQKPHGDGEWRTTKGTMVEGAYVQQIVPVDDAPYKPEGPPSTETRIFWRTGTLVAAEE